ncbi:IclR family transcriptional regulator C-terminal domain-containing protein [Spirillospora sp. NPDC049024]
MLAGGLVHYAPHTIVMPGLRQREPARTADRGYAVNREEPEADVSAVAAPVLDHRRQVIAVISITGNACRLDLDRLAPAVRTAALALSRELARENAGTLEMGIPRRSLDTGESPFPCTGSPAPGLERPCDPIVGGLTFTL